jgi:hypothetical protein
MAPKVEHTKATPKAMADAAYHGDQWGGGMVAVASLVA